LTQKAIFLMLLDLYNVINPKFHFKVLPLEGIRVKLMNLRFIMGLHMTESMSCAEDTPA